MKFVRTFLLVPLCLLACALFSPAALPTSTSASPATVTVAPLPTESLTTVPTILPPVTLSVTDFTPILFRDGISANGEYQVIGGVQAGNWLAAGVVAEHIQQEQVFDLYAPSGYAGTAVAASFNARCGGTYMAPEFSTDNPNLIGVAEGWNVGYRPWREIPVNTPVYYAAVSDWLVSQGYTLPYVQINNILLVDLEGDGVDEVLISAAYFKDDSGHMAQQGDYSIILMRKLVGGDVLAIPVVAELYTNPTAELVYPFTYTLINLLDLNQDGILDLIAEVSRWEGGGAAIYEVNGTNVTEAIRAICTQ